MAGPTVYQYEIICRSPGEPFAPATWEDGEPRFKAGLTEALVREAAIQEMMECVEREPEKEFALIDHSGQVMMEVFPDKNDCPF
jgi:hypothetical protein